MYSISVLFPTQVCLIQFPIMTPILVFKELCTWRRDLSRIIGLIFVLTLCPSPKVPLCPSFCPFRPSREPSSSKVILSRAPACPVRNSNSFFSIHSANPLGYWLTKLENNYFIGSLSTPGWQREQVGMIWPTSSLWTISKVADSRVLLFSKKQIILGLLPLAKLVLDIVSWNIDLHHHTVTISFTPHLAHCFWDPLFFCLPFTGNHWVLGYHTSGLVWCCTLST